MRMRLDIDDSETLDGADVADRSPKPDDEDYLDQRTQRLRTSAGAAERSLSEMHGLERRSARLRLARGR